MAENNAANVMFGKPIEMGAIYWAPYGTSLPSNGTSTLGDDFVCVGYVSEDGFSESTPTDSEDIQAWGGDIVASSQTSYGKEFTFTLIETSEDSLRLVWGSDAVDGTAPNLTVKHTSKEHPYISLVCEMKLKEEEKASGTTQSVLRKVMERAKVSEVGDISYTDGDVVGYELTVKAYPVDSTYMIDYYAEVDTSDAEKTSVTPTSAKTTTTSTATKKE